jgi:hypothetical protein
MSTILKFAGALALATVIAAPTAFAKGGHGGGHFGGGGGHPVGGGLPPIVMKSPGFKGGGVRGVPHHVQPHVVHANPGNWNGGHHNQHHHRHHGRFLVYSPLYNYDYSAYDRGGCGWLWQRYLNTGNRTWKYRYYECIE